MNLLNREVLLVDKPAGISSFGVVARVRRILTEQMREDYARRGLTPPKKAKVGHAGTLDPFATGLLICLLGKGTKKAGEFLKKDKRYEATIKLGEVSTTGDVEGEISDYIARKQLGSIPTGVWGPATRFPMGLRSRSAPREPARVTPSSPLLITELPTKQVIEDVLRQFTGEVVQRVPAYSAVKINGRRAYDLARKGIEVEMPERKVTIYELNMVSYDWPFLKIDCKVSSGTYIRALGEDIGKALGVGGYLTELRRTEIVGYKVSEAVTLEEIMEV